MIYSLSEIDANCKKAARGAGLNWGYAEESGKTARWLAAHQLPGAALLAHYLPERAARPEIYQSKHAPCPLLKGATLCDVGVAEPLLPIEVVYPLLILPYLFQLSSASQTALHLSWEGADIYCQDDRVYLNETDNLLSASESRVLVNWLSDQEDGALKNIMADLEPLTKVSMGQDVESSHWQALESLAHHTYVPATEASRRGAGPAD